MTSPVISDADVTNSEKLAREILSQFVEIGYEPSAVCIVIVMSPGGMISWPSTSALICSSNGEPIEVSELTVNCRLTALGSSLRG